MAVLGMSGSMLVVAVLAGAPEGVSVRPAPSTVRSWDIGAMVAGQAADTVTTCVAIRSGRLREHNPLLPESCSGIVAVKVLSTLGAAQAVHLLRQRGHPKLARLVAWSWAIAGATGAIVNVVQLRR